MNSAASKNDFIFRNYSDEDYDEIVSFWEITDMGNPERGDTRETIRRTIEIGGCLLVMEERSTGDICGTSWITVDGRRATLHHFGILPAYQGKGLSKMLLKESFRFVNRMGLQLKLEVHSNNYRAINLYKKFGFLHLGEYNVYIIRDTSKLPG